MTDRRLRGCPVVVLDTETTGLSSADGLVEVAFVQIDALMEPAPRGAPRLLFHSLIDPCVTGPWQGTYVHRLTPRDVEGAPVWLEVFEQIRRILCDPEVVLCAHNAPFDRRFLDSDITPIRPSAEWVDTLKIGQRIDPTAGASKLGPACRARGIPYDGHRAKNDAFATARLLPMLIRETYSLPVERRPPERPTVGQWLEWQRAGARRSKASAPVSQEGLFEEQAVAGDTRKTRRTSEMAAPWIVRGGVGGTMYCGSAEGVWPFRWVHRPQDARRFTHQEFAIDVASKVRGRVERVAE